MIKVFFDTNIMIDVIVDYLLSESEKETNIN